jgi:REP element-mobilizing transposase RayT
MDQLTHNGADKLRRGRISIPFARYFITLCVRNRIPKLTAENIPDKLADALRQLHTEHDIELICATTMPDHFHILYRLGKRLKLGQIQAKLKSLTNENLQSAGIEWQQNYYDHRLREQMPMDRFARYLFLNPYTKRLIQCDEPWPYWLVNQKLRPEFMEHLRDGRCPPVQWLQNADSAKALVDEDLEERSV